MTDSNAHHRILVATDFSDHALKAVGFGVGIAERFGSELLLLFVMPDAHGTAESVVSSRHFPNLHDEVEKACRRQLEDQRASEVPAGLPCRELLEYGTPFDVILRMAAAKRVDLIVMGTHGRSGVLHALMGSTAERVVREAPCAVLTVR